jgi:threonine dehydratase
MSTLATPTGDVPTSALPSWNDIEAAAARIEGLALRTPVMPGRGHLDELVGATLFFKCENLQRVGAFKFRGAMNAVLQLDADALARGVATHSSGNHAAAVALAARLRGARAHVVMPEGSAAPKVEAVRGYGAEVTFCANTQQAREKALAEIVARTGASFVHPYDDWRVVCGAATAAREFLDEVPDLDVLLTPVGGGGLASGSALTCKLRPGRHPAFVAVEPEAADDAARSLATGVLQPQPAPRTIADGLRTALSERTFAVLRTHADGIVTVSEAEIVAAMRLLMGRLNLVVEPSAAVPFAALLAGRLPVAGKRVGIVLTGGNVDLDALPWALPAQDAPTQLGPDSRRT